MYFVKCVKLQIENSWQTSTNPAKYEVWMLVSEWVCAFDEGNNSLCWIALLSATDSYYNRRCFSPKYLKMVMIWCLFMSSKYDILFIFATERRSNSAAWQHVMLFGGKCIHTCSRTTEIFQRDTSIIYTLNNSSTSWIKLKDVMILWPHWDRKLFLIRSIL